MDGRERMGERRERPVAGFRGGDGGAAIAAAWSSPALPKKALRCTI
jgi:hypothetical protein